ncbi:AAA family ATPase [Acidithiobacillus sp.]|jgi:ABC-type uncharacterized transport system ATPase component|uniref:AAA family ATPase n=1 Tax=Acidithiobacillus sp. TaxID=1872118 RepID=UPI00356967D0
MRLVFKTRHLSIDQFNPVEIPDFVVLTGVNGSGKSHLVQAIENGSVLIEGLNNPHVVHFNYETFKLENEGAFNAQQLFNEREQAWNFYQQQVTPQATSWRNSIQGEYQTLRDECVKENKPFWSAAKERVQQYTSQGSAFLTQKNLRSNAQAQGVYSLAKKIPYGIDEIDHNTFVSLYKPYQFTKDFLPHQLGKIFWDYYAKYRHNQLNAFENEKYNKGYPSLSEEDFIEAHGRKPWELANEILATFYSLKYRVNSPEGTDMFSSFQLKLQHIEKPGLEVDFGHLSSGERVLMALVASVYKSSADRLFPDVLLLDEVDASLHPSMMQNMLKVIEEIFLKHGVKVILVSHSPTTIALAPDESIFAMQRSGTNRIEKKSKEEALSILTEGFATIEQGLRLFDQVARSSITIITEGHNEALLRKALELFHVEGVEVLPGVQDITGKTQLRTVFQFFCKVQHQNKVIVVWDCDAPNGLEEEERTYPYVIPTNPRNSLTRKGIENAFPEHLFQPFIKTMSHSNGNVVCAFDESRKSDFARHVVDNATLDDFVHFQGLVTEIKRVKALS